MTQSPLDKPINFGPEVDHYLVGFKFSNGEAPPELYTLYLFDLSNDRESPLLDREGRVLFVDEVFKIDQFLLHADARYDLAPDLPLAGYNTYYLYEALQNLRLCNDGDGELSSFLVFVIDFFEHTSLPFEEDDKKLVVDLFCHIIEFGGDLSGFPGKSGYEVSALSRGLNRTFGLIFEQARYVGAAIPSELVKMRSELSTASGAIRWV